MGEPQRSTRRTRGLMGEYKRTNWGAPEEHQRTCGRYTPTGLLPTHESPLASKLDFYRQ